MTLKNFWNNEKFHIKLFYLFLLIQPLLDMVTSIMLHIFETSLTLGIVVRTLFMGYIFLFVLLNRTGDKRLKKLSLGYFAVAFLFCALLVGMSLLEKGVSGLFIEVKGLTKSLYFPIVLVGAYYITKTFDIKISAKLLSIVLSGYTAVIFIATITGTSFYSYGYKKMGSKGWFYAANEIGTIIAILLPFMFMYLFSEKKAKDNKSYDKKGLLFGLCGVALLVFSVLMLATKVPLLALFGYIIVFLILFAFYCVGIDKKYLYKCLSLILTAVAVCGVYRFTPSYDMIKGPFNQVIEKLKTPNTSSENTSSDTSSEEPGEKDSAIKDIIMSNRTKYVASQKEKFKDSPIQNHILGLGVAQKAEDGKYVETTVEQDFLDVFFHYGYLGFAVFFLPLLLALIKAAFLCLKHFKKAFFSLEVCTGLFSLLLGLGVSALAGHTLTAPAVSIFIVIDVIFLYQNLKQLESA